MRREDIPWHPPEFWEAAEREKRRAADRRQRWDDFICWTGAVLVAFCLGVLGGALYHWFLR